MTVPGVRERKGRAPLTMVTAYDYPTALFLDQAGVDLLLVGDSLGMAVYGDAHTLGVTLDEMVRHSRAVSRATSRALVVSDLPFLTYASREEAIRSAKRCLAEGGAAAVKVEGAGPVLDIVSHLSDFGVPVMGHLGLTPQFYHQLGGFRVQGRGEEARRRLVEAAIALEQAGIFALVLEAVPTAVARAVREAVSIPTLGIGAGPECDGQVLVFHDLVGLTPGKSPRFAKRYADLGQAVVESAHRFVEEVREGRFPGAEHSYREEGSGRGAD